MTNTKTLPWERGRSRAVAVLRLVALGVSALSLALDCGIYWAANYGGGVSPPQYAYRGPVFEALTFPSPAYLAVLAAPGLALACAILSWRQRARSDGRGRPPLGTVAVAVIAALGLVPIAGDLDLTGSTTLYRVSMTSTTVGWAVGAYSFNRGGAVGVIWRYDESGWREVARQANAMRDVVALPDGEAWAVGDGGAILRESGGRWNPMDGSTADDLWSVAMRTPTEGWAVGGHETIRLAAAIQRDGVAPEQPDGGTCVILHYLQGRWSPVACPVAHHLQRVAVLPNGEAWAIGDRILLHEANGRWAQVPAPAGRLSCLAMTSPEDGWAAGFQGAMVHYQAGTWTAVPPVTTAFLEDVVTSPAGDGWMVGDNVILHRQDGAWVRVYEGKGEALFGIALVPGAGYEGWAVGAGTGASPAILRLRGGSWQAYPVR